MVKKLTNKQWYDICTEFESSTMTGNAFAEKHKISSARLYQKRNEFGLKGMRSALTQKQENEVQFNEVTLVETEPVSHQYITISVGCAKLEVGDDVDTDLLKKIVGVLSSCC